MRAKAELHDYQRDAVHWIQNRKSGLLLADIGTGKTAITATAFSELVDEYAVAHVLIAAPKLVATTGWPDEFRAWEHLSHIEPLILSHSWKRNVALVEQGPPPPFTLIPMHYLAKLIEAFYETPHWRWDVLVVDESSKLKNQATKVFRACRRVRNTVRIFELTASPSPQDSADLWTQTYLIDGGAALGGTITSFRHAYMHQSYAAFNKWSLRQGADLQIANEIAPLCHRIDAADYGDKPEPLVIDKRLTLPDYVLETYKQFERDLIADIDEEVVTAVNAAVLSNKLRQIANGSVYTDEHGTYSCQHDLKLDALAEIVDAAQGRPVMVAYEFKSDLARMRERFGDTLVKLDTSKPEILQRWNAGQIQLLAAHPASCGHGLNLQGGGHLLVFYTLPWSLEAYQQTIGRLARQGQSVQVVVYRLITEGTVDALVPVRLAGRGTAQSLMLERIKNYRK